MERVERWVILFWQPFVQCTSTIHVYTKICVISNVDVDINVNVHGSKKVNIDVNIHLVHNDSDTNILLAFVT